MHQTIKSDILKNYFTESIPKKIKVIISNSDMKFMESLAWEATKKNLETGGYFIGTQIGNDTYIISKCTGPGSDALESSVMFQADISDMQKEIDLMREKYDVFWIGTWHVHPRNFCGLSGTDTSSMKQFLKDPECMDYDFAMVFSAYGKEMKYGIWMMKKDDKKLITVNIITENQISKYLPKIKEIKDNHNQDKINTYFTTLKQNGYIIFKGEIDGQYFIIESTINKFNATFLIPFNERESPILFIDGNMRYVPINWNSLCSFEDFVSAINIDDKRSIDDKCKKGFLTKIILKRRKSRRT